MATAAVSEAFVREFTASMPPAYRSGFPPDEIVRHASIVRERGSAHAHVARHSSVGHPTEIALCIVADDQPGLLATICAALVLHDLDVVKAEAYTRIRADGQAEAVDFFWVRELGSDPRVAVTSITVAALEATLCCLIEGSVDWHELGERLRYAPAPSRSETRVRFGATVRGGLEVLEVETADRVGLLLALARALHRAGVCIARAQVRTEQGKVLDRFVVTELDGRPIGPARRLEIQVAVLDAIQPVPRTREPYGSLTTTRLRPASLAR